MPGNLRIPRKGFDHMCVYVLCCRQTWDQDERSHLLPSHRRGLLRPFEERAQSKSSYVCLCVWLLPCGLVHTKHHFLWIWWHLFVFSLSPSICLPPSHTCVTSPSIIPPTLSATISLVFLHFKLTSTSQEPKPLADIQREDPRPCLLHGGSVPRGHENLDGRYCHRCWRTHAFHGVTNRIRSGCTHGFIWVNFLSCEHVASIWDGRSSSGPLRNYLLFTLYSICSLRWQLMLRSTFYNIIMYNWWKGFIYRFHI